jgi:hypothetical protein
MLHRRSSLSYPVALALALAAPSVAAAKNHYYLDADAGFPARGRIDKAWAGIGSWRLQYYKPRTMRCGSVGAYDLVLRLTPGFRRFLTAIKGQIGGQQVKLYVFSKEHALQTEGLRPRSRNHQLVKRFWPESFSRSERSGKAATERARAVHREHPGTYRSERRPLRPGSDAFAFYVVLDDKAWRYERGVFKTYDGGMEGWTLRSKVALREQD